MKNNVNEWIDTIPETQRPAIISLREILKNQLPKGFEEVFQGGMLSYVVPYSIYPQGYHCKPKQPLPFISLAAQKNYIALYHLGIYANPELLEWFQAEYKKQVPTKLDMGKSCIRFKKPEQIPYDLIGQLVTKISVDDWIAVYEKNQPMRKS
jgi:hypothetical protein